MSAIQKLLDDVRWELNSGKRLSRQHMADAVNAASKEYEKMPKPFVLSKTCLMTGAEHQWATFATTEYSKTVCLKCGHNKNEMTG